MPLGDVWDPLGTLWHAIWSCEATPDWRTEAPQCQDGAEGVEGWPNKGEGGRGVVVVAEKLCPTSPPGPSPDPEDIEEYKEESS